MALDLPLPKQVFGHPWLLQGDGKMSKSKGNVIYADDLVELFGVDAVRYFVLHEMPFENDGVITWDLMVERLNSDLANTLGNLLNRTVSMSNKYFDGVVADKGVTDTMDEDLKQVVLSTVDKVNAKMNVADAISEIFVLFKRCNKYIDETMPWALAKDPEKQDRLATVLYNLVESICIGGSLLYSFMPETSAKILAQLNASKRELSEMHTFGLYESGTKVTEQPEILFFFFFIKEVLEKVEAKKAAAGESKEKEEITFEDFEKMQFQVGEIISCEAVKKSKKLLCSQVKIGSEVKQIVSGIKAHYSPEEMVGKKVMVLVNLKPAKLAGVLSEGMILCAEDENGELALMVPEKKMPAGAEIWRREHGESVEKGSGLLSGGCNAFRRWTGALCKGSRNTGGDHGSFRNRTCENGRSSRRDLCGPERKYPVAFRKRCADKRSFEEYGFFRDHGDPDPARHHNDRFRSFSGSENRAEGESSGQRPDDRDQCLSWL